MFPNAYLKNMWEMTIRPHVFVAMSFAETYKRRYEEVIVPAIRAVKRDGIALEPYRVDFSKSGDSILTDIIDGIAHCTLFIADVSIIGNDSKSGTPYRNGNVMYEVGLAVACRQPTEILLIRDDQERFLFDVSTIPHVHLNFVDTDQAKLTLQELLSERLREITYINDVRVRQTIASLSSHEVHIIKQNASVIPPRGWGFEGESALNFLSMAAIPRLLDKKLIQCVAQWRGGGTVYCWTPLGVTVANHVAQTMPTIASDIKKSPTDK